MQPKQLVSTQIYLPQKMINTEIPVPAGIAHSSSVNCSVGLAVLPMVWYANAIASDTAGIQTYTLSCSLLLEFGGAAWNRIIRKERPSKFIYVETTNEMSPASPHDRYIAMPLLTVRNKNTVTWSHMGPQGRSSSRGPPTACLGRRRCIGSGRRMPESLGKT
jgi:hypothetical protein